MISVEDVEALNMSLVSDRAKTREDGVKALGSYLEGAAGLRICPLLDQQTALLRANERIPSATWPGVLHALCDCIVKEVEASKKRGPKPVLAKTLRNLVHKAEDSSRSGKTHFLLRKIKRLFQHILDMLREVPAFSSDYSHMLRELLPDVEYRLRMGKKIYNDLVTHYLAKAKEIAHSRSFEAAVAKEDAFRNTLTLLILLQNPPGDIAAYVKSDIVESFNDIFTLNRDEDRITKKLVAALNAFLLADGLNLGDEVVKLHSSFRPFMVRTWLTTRDRDLKDELVLYARMQLKLQYIVASDDGSIVEELLGLVEKELDQTGVALTGFHRYDMMREDKVGSVSRSERGFLEFAAATFFEVGKRDAMGWVHGKATKRRKRESVYTLVGEKISAAKILWDGAFCVLIRNFGNQLPPKFLEAWLDGLASNLERVMTEGVNTRSFGAPVWTLRCLQELSNICRGGTNTLCKKPIVWQSIWDSMLHWLPLISNVSVMVDEAFRLLGLIATMRLVPVYNISPSFWDLQMFSEVPSGNILYFIAAFFACPGSQAVSKADLDLRQKLLTWSMTSLDLQDIEKAKGTAVEATPLVLSAAVLALSLGFFPLHPSNKSPLQNCSSLDLTKDLPHWAECKEQEVLLESMDRSLYSSPRTGVSSIESDPSDANKRSISPLPRSSSDLLLQHLSELLLEKVGFVQQKKDEMMLSLPYYFYLSGLLVYCIYGVEQSTQRRGQRSPDWCSKGRLWVGLSYILEVCLSVLEGSRNRIQSSDPSRSSALSASLNSFLHEFTPATLAALSSFLSSPGKAVLVSIHGRAYEPDTVSPDSPLMALFLEALQSALNSAASVSFLAQDETSGSPATVPEDREGDVKLMDIDLDEFSETGFQGSQSLDGLGSTKKRNNSLYDQWKDMCLKMVVDIGRVLPETSCEVLLSLLDDEKDTKMRWKIVLMLCELMKEKTIAHLPEVVRCIERLRDDCQDSESARFDILTGIDAILTNLLVEDKGDCRSAPKLTPTKGVQLLPEEVLPQLASIVTDIEKMNLLLWPTREKFVNTVFNYILVSPSTAQGLTEKLLSYLHDTEYRVRRLLSMRSKVFFQTWDGHEGLLRDVCANFGVKMVMVTTSKVVRASDVKSAGPQPAPFTETALLTLGEIAASSDTVEGEALFMMCAHAALNPSQRLLVSSLLDRVANLLQYPHRWKYLDYVMGALLTRWVRARLAILSLVEIKDVLSGSVDTTVFLEHCCPWLLPSLFLYDDNDELEWIARSMSLELSALVRRHFASIFATLLPLHSHGTPEEQHKAGAVLQRDMLAAAQLTEDERDTLIRNHMIAIVNFLFRLCGDVETPQFPHFTRDAISSAVRTVVDGFLDIDPNSQDEGVVDMMQVFRPNRVFMMLLQLHYESDSAYHPRHRRHLLASLLAIMTVIDKRVVVSSTCRYIVHIILQSIEIKELQKQCCTLLGYLLDKVESSPLSSPNTFSDQLQSIVSKVVSCITAYGQSSNDFDELQSIVPHQPHVLLVELLERLTVKASPTLHDSIKELNPFPELRIFEPMRALHNSLCSGRSLADEFVQFVKRAPSLPSQLQLSSLRSLANELKYRKDELYAKPFISKDGSRWRCSSEVVSAAWRLVRLCDEENLTDMRDLAGIFLAAVGMGNPHAVVFHLPEESGEDISRTSDITEVTTEAPDTLVKQIMLQMRGYLVDNSVQIIELTSRTLKGLLSTEQGHRVLRTLTFKESAYLEVHSKGINPKLVADMLTTSQQESASTANSAENPQLWTTVGKTYNHWICELVHSFIEYTDDQILRICQGLVLKKAALAELVFSYLLGALAARNEPDSELCQTISKQVEEHILGEQNQDMRSIQLFLGALNTLRCSYVATTMKGAPSKGKDNSKGDKGKSGPGTSDQEGVQKNESASSWQKVYWLQIDYLITAGAAQRCAAYFTTILYVEHWCEDKFGSLTLGEPDFSMSNKLPAHIELLLLVYTKINEPDGVYGVARSHKVRSQLLTYEHEGNWNKAVETYDLLLRSRKSPMLNPRSGDAAGSSADEPKWQSHKGLMRSLRQMGCTYVVDLCNQSLAQQRDLECDPEFRELQYEAAWRSCNWDSNLFGLDVVDDSFNGQAGGQKGLAFHAHLHSCLRALVEGDAEIFYPRLQQARQSIITSMSLSSMESTQTVNPAIMKLQMLEGLSQSWEMRWRMSQRTTVAGPLVPSDNQVYAFEGLWQENIRQMQSHYDLLEPYITFRKVMFHVLNRQDCLPRHLLEFSTLARKAERRNQAADSLHELKLILNGSNDQSSSDVSETAVGKLLAAARVEEAKILWAQGQQEMAVNLMKYILQHSDVEAGESAALLCLTGKWLAETRSDSFRVILELYLGKSVEVVENAVKSVDKSSGSYVRWAQRLCRTHYRLAHYTDSLYRSYEDRLVSSEWQAALRLRQHKSRELETLKKRISSQKGDARDYSMKIFELHKQLTLDDEEDQRMQGDKEQFLGLALDSYRSCLLTGNKYDLRVVFRLLSLWFNLSTNLRVVAAMLETVKTVQSYKFVPLVYQIASRMGSSKEQTTGTRSFQHALSALVERMAIEHPYHTMYQIFALANGDRVKENQRGKIAFVVDMDKKHTAVQLLKRLAVHHKDLLLQMKRMVEIYIKLAELETKKEDTNKRIPLPRDIRSVRQLELVPVLTAHIPVDPACQYHKGSFPYYNGLSDTLQIMNGINAPKVLECKGSDGRRYKQLAKSGNDDLRQDAVMEQLFGLVNTLLQDHPDTCKRQLCIRTYKVVPFTPSAGVLEWVDGTIPLGEYLLGSTRSGGAHARYGGNDWTFMKCREHMSVDKDKRHAFETVCNYFRPVMHNFFLERFSQAADWFEKRLAYTRSVATSSMVGYVVGLGDRHSMNVLLDQVTAEVVHIDLGVAFEQGLMLKTPERVDWSLVTSHSSNSVVNAMGNLKLVIFPQLGRLRSWVQINILAIKRQVPFRLTRDIIDGMGVSGVEGIFRRCCEATLSVMRTNKDALLTIIEVFIYDPLYKWALSPLKALQRQQEASADESGSEDQNQPELQDEGNKDAARALLRVKQKLDGYEGGEMRSLQGQIQQLIQDAQDPERLSTMFPGWGAWL